MMMYTHTHKQFYPTHIHFEFFKFNSKVGFNMDMFFFTIAIQIKQTDRQKQNNLLLSNIRFNST